MLSRRSNHRPDFCEVLCHTPHLAWCHNRGGGKERRAAIPGSPHARKVPRLKAFAFVAATVHAGSPVLACVFPLSSFSTSVTPGVSGNPHPGGKATLYSYLWHVKSLLILVVYYSNNRSSQRRILVGCGRGSGVPWVARERAPCGSEDTKKEDRYQVKLWVK